MNEFVILYVICTYNGTNNYCAKIIVARIIYLIYNIYKNKQNLLVSYEFLISLNLKIINVKCAIYLKL